MKKNQSPEFSLRYIVSGEVISGNRLREVYDVAKAIHEELQLDHTQSQILDKVDVHFKNSMILPLRIVLSPHQAAEVIPHIVAFTQTARETLMNGDYEDPDRSDIRRLNAEVSVLREAVIALAQALHHASGGRDRSPRRGDADRAADLIEEVTQSLGFELGESRGSRRQRGRID